MEMFDIEKLKTSKPTIEGVEKNQAKKIIAHSVKKTVEKLKKAKKNN